MSSRGPFHPWILPLALGAAVWLWVAWLHTGGVGRPRGIPPLETAQFRILSEAGVAEPDAGGPLRLPHDWAETHPDAVRGEYALSVAVPEVPADGLGLYFPSVNTRGKVYMNGALVEGGSKFFGLTSHFWHLPLYVPVPAALLRPGENHIRVELTPDAPGGGYLAPPYLGPDASLRPAYEVRRFLQLTGVQILVIAMVAFGAFLALLYLLRRKDSFYMAFAAVSWVFALGFYNLLAIDAWLPKPSYRWLGAVTMAWLTVSITFFVHRFLEERRPKVELALAGGALAGSLYFAFTLGTPFYRPALPLWGALVLVAGLYPAWLVGRAFARKPTRELQLVVASGVLIASAGLHDVLLVNGPIPLEHDFAIVWASAVSVAIFAYLFVSRFIRALDTSEALTAELEERVAEKGAELERSYQSLRTLEQERAVAGERERLMAEIHDGMGGQLVSTLAMIQGGDAALAEVEDALRAALDDMRLVIHSLDADAADVPTLLGLLRARLGPRLERGGIRLRWQVDDVPPVRDFGPEAALHVMRIAQEAITNVVKHAHAKTLTVGTGVENGWVIVSLADDGIGMAGDGQPGAGLGLGNMQRRARALGGELTLRPAVSGAGTEVRLALPSA